MMPVELPTMLHCSLSLRPENSEHETEKVESFARLAGVVQKLNLIGPNLYQRATRGDRYPIHATHPLVLRAVELAHAAGMQVYWGRWLWVAFPNLSIRDQREFDWCSPEYLTYYVRRVEIEAELLGVAGTSVDAETYGTESLYGCDGRAWGSTFDLERRHQAEQIIDLAGLRGSLDYAYPAGSGDPERNPWTFRSMGKHYLHHTSYKQAGPPLRNTNPPDDLDLDLHVWGTWVTVDPATEPGVGALTATQWANIDRAALQAAYPELVGMWLYIHHDEWLSVVVALQEAAQKAESK